jgi:hypothetical protein
MPQNEDNSKECKRYDRENKALEVEKKLLTEAKLNAVNEKTVAKNAVSALTERNRIFAKTNRDRAK